MKNFIVNLAARLVTAASALLLAAAIMGEHSAMAIPPIAQCVEQAGTCAQLPATGLCTNIGTSCARITSAFPCTCAQAIAGVFPNWTNIGCKCEYP
jgi:hypothetical protein